MFKKFDRQHISKQNLMRGSDLKAVKKYLIANYNITEEKLEEIFPKKKTPMILRMSNRTSVIMLDSNYLVIVVNDNVYIPTLYVLHKYPDMLKSICVDQGAVKSLLRGANLMGSGIISKDPRTCLDTLPNVPVAVYVYGKEHAIAIGISTVPTNQISKSFRGIAASIIHHLGDELWKHEATNSTV